MSRPAEQRRRHAAELASTSRLLAREVPVPSFGVRGLQAYKPWGNQSWAACWETAIRQQMQTRKREDPAVPLEDACPCPKLPPQTCNHVTPRRWRRKAVRLVAAVSAHIGDETEWMLLRRALCSIRSHHPDASILVVDQASPEDLFRRLSVISDRGNASISVCRSHKASSWALGAIQQAYEWAQVIDATHVAYFQHNMMLNQPLPLSNHGDSALSTYPNCSFASFQVFPGDNYDSMYRTKHFVMRMWVDHEWTTRLHQRTAKGASGVYSHGFVATTRALQALDEIGLFGVRVCSKFQDEGVERMLGRAAEGPLNSTQSRCNLDGDLFSDAIGPSTSQTSARSFYVEKVSHLRPSNFVMRAGRSVTTYSELNHSQIMASIGHLCPAFM